MELASQQAVINAIRLQFPWPAQPPKVPPNPHGWFTGEEVFPQWCGDHVKIVLELGTWLGKSARYFCDHCPNATVICVDHWKGSPNHDPNWKWRPLIPVLYDTFVVNMWGYRDRVVPVKMDADAGLEYLAELGLKPDLLYIDAGHCEHAVYGNATRAIDFFPDAQIFGDDWQFDEVRLGVTHCLQERGLCDALRCHNRTWWLDQDLRRRDGT